MIGRSWNIFEYELDENFSAFTMSEFNTQLSIHCDYTDNVWHRSVYFQCPIK